MKSYALTTRQKDVLDFVKDYIGKNKQAPYIREIQEGCGIFSYKAAVDKLLSLEKKGYIRRMLNKHRGIALVEETVSVTETTAP